MEKYPFMPGDGFSSRRSFLVKVGGLAGTAVATRGYLQAQKQHAPALDSQAPTLNSQNDTAVFSSDVKVVNVLATVRTKGGEIVADLTRDDFILTEDGRQQNIRYFSRETNLPLILGLLVDTSGSQRNVLGEEQEASFRFLDKVLREDLDKTFLAHFDFDTELLQDLTSSKKKLRQGLETLEMPSQWNRRFGMGGGGRRGGGGGGTVLYDAVYLGSDEIMQKQEGRKAFVLLTDGVDHGSRLSLNTAIEAAQRADTLVYSILFDGDEGGGMIGGFGRVGPMDLGPDGRKVLQKMSRETGGGFFEVSRKLNIDTIYRRIEEELRSQYSLGYSPDRPPDGGGFRTISIKARRKDLVVQARQGYYPTT